MAMAITSKSHHSHMESSQGIRPVSSEDTGGLKVAKPVLEHIEGNALLVDKEGHIRRLPIASRNPNDPLNFKTWEKAAIVLCCCWLCKSHMPRSFCLLVGIWANMQLS